MTDDRKEAVAAFLKSDPRYVELGLQIEAALGLLREGARAWVLECVRKRMEVLGTRGGWKLERTEGAPVLRRSGWDKEKWSGIYVWPAKEDSPELEVGVADWPDSMKKDCFLRAGCTLVDEFRNPDAWSEHHHNQAEKEKAAKWIFHGDRDVRLLAGEQRDATADEIVALVSELMNAAEGYRPDHDPHVSEQEPVRVESAESPSPGPQTGGGAQPRADTV